MTFQSKLNFEKRQELIVDYKSGYNANDLSVIYRVSIRTVFRILAEAGVPRKQVPSKPRKVKFPKPLKPCGTEAAYRRHKRNGEYPCTECLAAHAKNTKRWKPPPKRLKGHGTDARYQRHLRNGETPCDKCKAAHNRRKKRQRDRRKRLNGSNKK